MGNLYRLLGLGVLLMVFSSVAAQHHDPIPADCAVPTLTTAQRQLLEQQAADALKAKQATNAPFTTITYVPIRPHILRKSNGTGGISLASINQVIAVTNNYYLLNGYGIQFYLAGTTPDYVDNDQQYDGFSNEELVASGHDAPNALNQYYVNAFASGGIGGYAYYPTNELSSTRSFILNEYYNLDDMGNRLIPHELGHTFNLIHTFGDNSGTTTELVTRGAGANCSTAGDLLCDTPADPYGKQGTGLIYDANGCPMYNPNNTARDANNTPYSPSIANIMSYYFPCTHTFTTGQYDRMQAGLALRQSHTAYSLTYPPTPVPAPSNVATSLSNNQVTLTWQDNGTNEMGYFIERSQSPSSGFVLIGGVGPDATSFVDTKTAAFATYYYRVKPSNSTTGVSPVASITTATCHPDFGSNGCTANDGLDGFVLNNVVFSQNSDCSTGGYSSSTAVSTNVSAGRSYSFTGTLLSATYNEGITIWADLNRNHVFEASQGELLYQTPNLVTGQFSGTLSLPGSLTLGRLDLRVIVAYNMVPTDPCGSYSYGETEDYVLNVVGNGADLSLSMQNNRRIIAVNQSVSYSLTVRNDGPLDATGIQWQNRLPAGLAFVSGDAGVTGSSTVVNSTAGFSLGAGQAITFTYLLRPTQSGIYSNASQIVASDQLDPDSQPGSGTGDGQDDAASVDLRTPDNDGTVYSSPNPNQTPLPSVLSSQPAPDPAKADLSLAMTVDNRTPKAGQLSTFTISIANAGGLTASNIVVRDTLRGLSLTSSSSGVRVVSGGNGYTIVEGQVASLAAGATAQLVFVVSNTTTGYVRNAAQIWSASPADPDSTPGSATPNANNLNGEDDVAWIDLRVGVQ